MIKNKDPRIKQIRESFCRLKAQLLLNFMILKIPMGSALYGAALSSFAKFYLLQFAFSVARLSESSAGSLSPNCL